VSLHIVGKFIIIWRTVAKLLNEDVALNYYQAV